MSTPYLPRHGRVECAVVHQPAGAHGSLPGRESSAVRPPLAGRDDKPERATPTFPSKVDLAREPASRASQGLIGTVTRRAPAPTREFRGTGGGTSRVLMSAAGRGIDADHAPVDPALGIGVGLDGQQDPLPCAVRRPPAMTIVNRLPVTEAGRQVPPGRPVRCRNRIPLITRRWDCQRPPRPRFVGRCGSSRAHSSSERSPRPMSHGTSAQRERHATHRTRPSRHCPLAQPGAVHTSSPRPAM